jgi:hypothetical protein
MSGFAAGGAGPRVPARVKGPALLSLPRTQRSGAFRSAGTRACRLDTRVEARPMEHLT